MKQWQLKMQSLHPTTCQRANHHLQQHEQGSSRGGLVVSSIWCMCRALHWLTMPPHNHVKRQQSRKTATVNTTISKTHMPLRQHTNGSNTLYILNMDVWSDPRWLQPQQLHHSIIFTPQVTHTSPNLAPTWPVERCCKKGAHICPRDSIPMAQPLYKYLNGCTEWSEVDISLNHDLMIWHHFHPTSNDPEFPIWGQLGRCNGIRVHPYVNETAHQGQKHFVYVSYGCMKWFKDDVYCQLNYDAIASFPSHNWPWEFPNLGPTWLVEWCKGPPICPWDSISIAQTLCVCLMWMFEVVRDVSTSNMT
jgi:hypothetical protein